MTWVALFNSANSTTLSAYTAKLVMCPDTLWPVVEHHYTQPLSTLTIAQLCCLRKANRNSIEGYLLLWNKK